MIDLSPREWKWSDSPFEEGVGDVPRMGRPVLPDKETSAPKQRCLLPLTGLAEKQ